MVGCGVVGYSGACEFLQEMSCRVAHDHITSRARRKEERTPLWTYFRDGERVSISTGAWGEHRVGIFLRLRVLEEATDWVVVEGEPSTDSASVKGFIPKKAILSTELYDRGGGKFVSGPYGVMEVEKGLVRDRKDRWGTPGGWPEGTPEHKKRVADSSRSLKEFRSSCRRQEKDAREAAARDMLQQADPSPDHVPLWSRHLTGPRYHGKG